jgi:hypothetical protein
MILPCIYIKKSEETSHKYFSTISTLYWLPWKIYRAPVKTLYLHSKTDNTLNLNNQTNPVIPKFCATFYIVTSVFHISNTLKTIHLVHFFFICFKGLHTGVRLIINCTVHFHNSLSITTWHTNFLDKNHFFLHYSEHISIQRQAIS